MQKNKIIISLTVLFISLFVVVGEVKADTYGDYISGGKKCTSMGGGKALDVSLWVVGTPSTIGDDQLPFASSPAYCVPTEAGSKNASYSELAAYIIELKNKNNLTAWYERYKTYPTGGNGWITIDTKKASEMTYDLTFNATNPERTKIDRVTGGDNIYIYFIRLDYTYSETPPLPGESKEDCVGKPKEECIKMDSCFWGTGALLCYSKTYDGGEKKDVYCGLMPKELCGTKDGAQACEWKVDNCVVKGSGVPGVTPPVIEEVDLSKYEGPLPACALRGDCRSVNDLVQLIVNFGSGLIMIIGGFAFLYFIYGGFTMIWSFGSAEKVEKGKKMLVSAVVGIAVVLFAYLLVKVMVDAFGLKESFNPLIKK